MNKKSKNKKGNKLNPAQNEGTKGNENVEVTEIVESVKNERVPEIVSEIPSTGESKEDAPKKPKRNRGKNKKGKDEDSNDIIDETANQDSVDIKKADIIKVIDKISSETTINVEESHSEITTAIPGARTKKNKTKTHEKSEDSALSQEVYTNPKEVLIEPNVNAELSEKFLQSESLEHDINLSKKKTKNKRRNESEKSDKGELVHSTILFQELLKSKCESENQTEIKRRDSITEISHQFKAEIEKINTEDLKSSTSNLLKNTTIEEQAVVEVSKGECKNKKQNKKDKRSARTKDQSIKLHERKSDVDQTSKQIKDVKQENTKEIITKESQEGLNSKPQAKIEKPVDIKGKGNFNTITDTILKDILKPTEYLEKNIDNINKEDSTIIIADILEISETAEQNKSDDNKKVLELKLTDNVKGKKRKNPPKSPKPDSKINDNKDILSTTVDKTNQVDSGEEPMTSLNLPLTFDCTEPISTQSHIDFTAESLKKDSILVTKIAATEKNIEVSNIIETRDAIIEGETIQKFEKKRNKSPKLPTVSKELMMTEQAKQYVKENIKEQSLKVFDTGKLAINQICKEKTNASSEEPRTEDIETRNVKTDESECSTFDAMPESSFSLRTSQQFFDDNNNNMVIRQILPDNIPADTPILPELIHVRKLSELTENEIDVVKQSSDIQKHSSKSKDTAIDIKEEKTDIKSKMIEVNQDMEELRLSIEKSLAEFTAIEKSEVDIEKKFEELNVEPSEILSVINVKDEILRDDIKFPKSSDKPIEVIGVKTITDKDKISEAALDDFQFQSSTVKFKNIVSQKTDTIIESSLLKKDDLDESFQAIDKKQDCISLTGNVPSIIATTTIHTVDEKKFELEETETIDSEVTANEQTDVTNNPPICPTRRDHKNKHKKKKGKQDSQSVVQESSTTIITSNTTESKGREDAKKEEQAKNKSENKEKGKQQTDDNVKTDNESIEHFEDALTSSVDDVNKIFEMILSEGNEQINPKINIIPPEEDKTSKVQPPKNLLGHPDIPASSNRRDYKKEKNKTPNESQAKVKIKDCADIEKTSKNTQTTNKIIRNDKNCVSDHNGREDFVYRYRFRKVFLQSSCHVCNKDLIKRVPCEYCNMVFYCSIRHKDEDWSQHQALCFAVSTIAHLKGLKYIYADVQYITGHDYRLVRMQMIVSCEKILKRRLVPWEQEALLYPRLCSTIQCREWRQGKLKDCEGCGQISYCSENPDHLPKTHQRWCKSYSLYTKLVSYQQKKGRLEPKLPSKVMVDEYQISEKINEVLASMYEEKIDMNDIEYAALTQIATAPLTASYGHQVYRDYGNNPPKVVLKQSCFTIHVVGAELQFEADALNKWEVFFLHLRPDLRELRVVLINHDLNPSNLPLDLLRKIKLCENCRQNKRRVTFIFQDKRSYSEYRTSDDFVQPDLVCAFNASIQRSSIYNGKDPWPATINTIVKLRTPFLVTAYTITELHKDATRVSECSELPYTVISEPKYNSFASVRPDRNFISDDDMPLIFKNYCYMILCG